MSQTAKVYFLHIGGEFFGAFGTREAATEWAAQSNPVTIGQYSFDVVEAAVTLRQLEDAMEGDIGGGTWEALVAGKQYGLVLGQ